MAEIEIKLRIPARSANIALRTLASLSDAPLQTIKMTADYYDTSRNLLLQSGYVLRLRVEGSKTVQTVKFTDSTTRDAHTREEWSDEINGNAPRQSLGRSGSRLTKKFGKLSLEYKFSTHVSRRIYNIERRGLHIEAAVDEGGIYVRGTCLVPIHEVELELKRGSPAALYEIALTLLKKARGAFEPESKSQRGYRALGVKPDVAKMAPPGFTASHTLADAVRAGARRYFAQYYDNMPAMMTGNHAAVHQMRVALRRLRSLWAAVEKFVPPAEHAKLSRELKSLQPALGNARDFAVLTEKLKKVPNLSARRTSAHKLLVVAMKSKADKSLVDAQRAVTGERHTLAWLRVMLHLETLNEKANPHLHEALDKAVPDILDDLFRRVRKRGRRYAALSPQERHRFRIACKKLRYGVEFFASLYSDKEIARFLSLLRRVQDGLGELNDAHVARGILLDPTQPKAVGPSAGEALGWLEHAAQVKTKILERYVHRLRQSGTYW